MEDKMNDKEAMRNPNEKDIDDDDDEETLRNSKIQRKIDLIEESLQKMRTKMDTYEMTSGSDRIIAEYMLEKLHTTYKEISEQLVAFVKGGIVKESYYRLPPNAEHKTRYPTEYMKILPVFNEFLREEGLAEGAPIFPYPPDIEEIIKHVMPGRESIARALADELLSNLKNYATLKKLERWMELEEENRVAEDNGNLDPSMKQLTDEIATGLHQVEKETAGPLPVKTTSNEERTKTEDTETHIALDDKSATPNDASFVDTSVVDQQIHTNSEASVSKDEKIFSVLETTAVASSSKNVDTKGTLSEKTAGEHIAPKGIEVLDNADNSSLSCFYLSSTDYEDMDADD